MSDIIKKIDELLKGRNLLTEDKRKKVTAKDIQKYYKTIIRYLSDNDYYNEVITNAAESLLSDFKIPTQSEEGDEIIYSKDGELAIQIVSDLFTIDALSSEEAQKIADRINNMKPYK